MHDTDIVDHHAGVLARRTAGDDEDRVVGREPRLQLLGRPGCRQVDIVLVERKHRNAARRQVARTGAADEAVGTEYDHPAWFSWSGIEMLEHDDFPSRARTRKSGVVSAVRSMSALLRGWTICEDTAV